MHRSPFVKPALLLAFAIAAISVLASPHRLDAQAGGRERTIFASAVGPDGMAVQGLDAGAFVVREDGVRREILRVSRAIEPIDIALLVDNSASSASFIVPLREGLKRFVETMASTEGAPPYQIAIIGLAARPTILSDYTADSTQLQNAVGRIFTDSTSGMTLLDAIVEVSRGLERRDTPRAVIVPVVTDGIEFTNRYYRDVLDAMSRAGVSFHAVTVGRFSVSAEDAVRNREFVLAEGARATGGQRVTLLSASAVTEALEKLAAELAGQYKIVYGRPDSLIPPERVEVDAGRPGLTVRGTPARGSRTGA